MVENKILLQSQPGCSIRISGVVGGAHLASNQKAFASSNLV